MNIFLNGTQARDKAIKGMDYVCNATKSTLGPFGNNFLLEKGNRITNDGFTISREMCTAIKDEFERRGAITIHEASSKTNDQVGDATTSAEVLAQAIIKEAIRYLPTEGSFASKMKSVEVINLINREKDKVIEMLKEKIKPIETEADLINSAKVSVEDDELAELIGKAQWEIGKDGIIIAEEISNYQSSIEMVKGIRIDNGLGTSNLFNNQEKQTLEVDNCQVIMTNYVVKDLIPFKNIIDTLVKEGKKNIAIIARAFTSEAIKICQANCNQNIGIYPINAPYTNQREMMKDLEAVLGGRYIDSEESNLEDINILDIGFASKIIARRYDAVLAGTNDDPRAKIRVDTRIEQLNEGKKGSISEFEKKMFESRISQLTNGFAILKVGTETDVERKRKKDKCEDAVNAVRLAFQGGTVAGGGLAFKEIAEMLPTESILKRPLNSIYDQIMSTAPEGYTIPEWCRDPYLVLVSALTNACSVSGTFSTIGGIVTSANPHQCQCQKSINEEEDV